jgi:hypothetical protein
MPPLTVSPTSITVGVPPVSDQSGAFAPGTVSVKVVEVSTSGTMNSNTVDGLMIQDLPPAPALPPGTVTLAFLSGVIDFATQMQSTIPGSQLDTPEFKKSSSDGIDVMNKLVPLVQAVVEGSSSTASLGSVNGIPVTFGSADLTNADRIVMGILVSLASSQTSVSSSYKTLATDVCDISQISQDYYSNPVKLSKADYYYHWSLCFALNENNAMRPAFAAIGFLTTAAAMGGVLPVATASLIAATLVDAQAMQALFLTLSGKENEGAREAMFASIGLAGVGLGSWWDETTGLIYDLYLHGAEVALYFLPSSPSWCTYQFSPWSPCDAYGTQTRSIESWSPESCVHGYARLWQLCPAPPHCNYTDIPSACRPDGTQVITSLPSGPAGCAGDTITTIMLCTYVPPTTTTCTYTYSDWSTCQPDGTQTREITGAVPAGCASYSDTKQSCTYVPPPTCDAFYCFDLCWNAYTDCYAHCPSDPIPGLNCMNACDQVFWACPTYTDLTTCACTSTP